jgi:Protein of unknown function (DUF3237)
MSISWTSIGEALNLTFFCTGRRLVAHPARRRIEVDVRLTLETDDKHQIYMAWKGLRHGPKEVMDRLYRGEIVDPGTYYFRTTPYFETSSEKYGWMNRVCSIASGSFSTNERALHVFQVL